MSTKRYKIEAKNIYGSLAHDFVNRYFRSAKAALNAFDFLYKRRGFQIVIFVQKDPSEEFVVSRIVKSTFR